MRQKYDTTALIIIQCKTEYVYIMI